MLIRFSKNYSKLNDEQKRFLKEGSIEASMSVPKWIRFLEPVCRCDKTFDSCRTILAIFLWLLLAALIFCSFIFLSDIESTIPMWLLSPWFMGMLAALIVGTAVYFELRKYDRNNNIREFIFPLLTLMSLEVGNRKKITLNIDFNKPLDEQDVSRQINPGRGGLFSSSAVLTTKFFDYPVLEMSCNLIDGTRVQWKVLDTVRKRKQKSSSGKTKTKIKLKRKMLLSMSFRPQLYALESPETAENDGFKIKENKIAYRRVLKESHTGKFALLDLEKLLEEIGKPYQLVTVKQNNESM